MNGEGDRHLQFQTPTWEDRMTGGTNKSKVMKLLGVGLRVMEGEDTFRGLLPQIIDNT